MQIKKNMKVINLGFLLAVTVASASTYRSSDIIHDPVKREGKLSEGEENEFVRRNGELL